MTRDSGYGVRVTGINGVDFPASRLTLRIGLEEQGKSQKVKVKRQKEEFLVSIQQSSFAKTTGCLVMAQRSLPRANG